MLDEACGAVSVNRGLKLFVPTSNNRTTVATADVVVMLASLLARMARNDTPSCAVHPTVGTHILRMIQRPTNKRMEELREEGLFFDNPSANIFDAVLCDCWHARPHTDAFIHFIVAHSTSHSSCVLLCVCWLFVVAFCCRLLSHRYRSKAHPAPSTCLFEHPQCFWTRVQLYIRVACALLAASTLLTDHQTTNQHHRKPRRSGSTPPMSHQPLCLA